MAELVGDRTWSRSTRPAVRLLAAITGSALVLLMTAAPNAHAAPGDLDPTFSGNGQALIDFAGGDDGASAVAVQPDGKVVAAGFASLPVAGRTFGVARFDSDGARDPSFSGNGIVTTRFGDGAAAGRSQSRTMATSSSRAGRANLRPGGTSPWPDTSRTAASIPRSARTAG